MLANVAGWKEPVANEKVAESWQTRDIDPAVEPSSWDSGETAIDGGTEQNESC